MRSSVARMALPTVAVMRRVSSSRGGKRHKTAVSGVRSAGIRMAQYKYREHLVQSSNSAFDTRHAPGTMASNPGIYRCVACGEEIAVPRRTILPADNHHKHEPGQGKVEWQMLVYAQQSK